MAADAWVYDGSTWRNIAEFWAYDGSTWREITEAWSYDGSAWRKVFESSSCATPTCDSGNETWTDTGCTDSNECNYCISLNHTDCDDSCHNIDGQYSTGGSYLNALSCFNKSCTNQSGTDCTGEFDCMLNTGGAKCFSDSQTITGRVRIQRDSDSVYECTRTGSAKSGACLT